MMSTKKKASFVVLMLFACVSTLVLGCSSGGSSTGGVIDDGTTEIGTRTYVIQNESRVSSTVTEADVEIVQIVAYERGGATDVRSMSIPKGAYKEIVETLYSDPNKNWHYMEITGAGGNIHTITFAPGTSNEQKILIADVSTTHGGAQ